MEQLLKIVFLIIVLLGELLVLTLCIALGVSQFPILGVIAFLLFLGLGGPVIILHAYALFLSPGSDHHRNVLTLLIKLPRVFRWVAIGCSLVILIHPQLIDVSDRSGVDSGSEVHRIFAAPPSRYLVTLTDKSLHLFNYRTRYPKYVISNDGNILDLVIVLDNATILSVSQQGKLCKYDLQLRKLLPCEDVVRGGAFWSSAKLSSRGNFVLATSLGGSQGQTEFLWSVKDKKSMPLREAHSTLRTSAFSPDERFLYRDGIDGIHRVTLETGEDALVASRQDKVVSALTLSSDGTLLIRVTDSGGRVEVIKLFTGESLGKLPLPPSFVVNEIATIPLSSYLLLKGERSDKEQSEREVLVFDLNSGVQVRSIDISERDTIEEGIPSDGEYLFSAEGTQDEITLWNLQTGTSSVWLPIRVWRSLLSAGKGIFAPQEESRFRRVRGAL